MERIGFEGKTCLDTTRGRESNEKCFVSCHNRSTIDKLISFIRFILSTILNIRS